MEPILWPSFFAFLTAVCLALIGIYPGMKGVTCVVPHEGMLIEPHRQYVLPHHLRMDPWIGPLLPQRCHHHHHHESRNQYTPQWIFRPEMLALVAPIVWLAPPNPSMAMDHTEAAHRNWKTGWYYDEAMLMKHNPKLLYPPMFMKKKFPRFHGGPIPSTIYPGVGSDTPLTPLKTSVRTSMAAIENPATKDTEYSPWDMRKYSEIISKMSEDSIANRENIGKVSGNGNGGNSGNPGDSGGTGSDSGNGNGDDHVVVKNNGGGSRSGGVSCSICDGDIVSCSGKHGGFDSGRKGIGAGSCATATYERIEARQSAPVTPTDAASLGNSRQNCDKSSLHEDKCSNPQSLDPQWFSILDKVNSPCKTLHTFSTYTPVGTSCSSNDLQIYAKEHRADMEEMFMNNCKCGCGGGHGCKCGSSARPTLEDIVNQKSSYNADSQGTMKCSQCNSSDCKCDQAVSYSKWAAYVKDVARRCNKECSHSNIPHINSHDYSHSDDGWRKSVCNKILDTVSKSLDLLKNEDLQICDKICVRTPHDVMRRARNSQASQSRRVRDTSHVQKSGLPVSSAMTQYTEPYISDETVGQNAERYHFGESHQESTGSRIQRSTDSYDPPRVDLVNDIRKSIGLLNEPKFRTFLGEPVAFEILYVLSKALDEALNEKMQAILQIENHTLLEENMDSDLIGDINNNLQYTDENLNQDCSVTKIKCDTTCSIHNPVMSSLHSSSNDCNVNGQNIIGVSSYSQESERSILPVSVILSPTPLCHSPVSQATSQTCCTSTVQVHNVCNNPDMGAKSTGGLDVQNGETMQPMQSYNTGSQIMSQTDVIGTNLAHQSNTQGSSNLIANTESSSMLPVSITLHPTPICAPKTEITKKYNCKYVIESDSCNGLHGIHPSKLSDSELETTNQKSSVNENGDKSRLTEANTLQELYNRLYNMHSTPRGNTRQNVVARRNVRQEENERVLNDLPPANEVPTDCMNSDGNVEVGGYYGYSSDFLPGIDQYGAIDEKDGAYEGNLFVESPEMFPDWLWYSPDDIGDGFSSTPERSDSDFTLGSPPTRFADQHSSGTYAQKEGSFSNTQAKPETPHSATAERDFDTSSTLNYAPYIWWSTS